MHWVNAADTHILSKESFQQEVEHLRKYGWILPAGQDRV